MVKWLNSTFGYQFGYHTVLFQPRLPQPAEQLVFWTTAAVGTVLDLWTKKAVFECLRNRPSVTIIDGFVRLVVVENPGAAFGMANGQRWLLTTVSVIALMVIFAVLLFSRGRPKLMYAVLGLLTAGVCGNLYDRIFNDGLVRDFIDVYYHRWHWPAFNIADTMLCIGVGLIIISSFRRSDRCRFKVDCFKAPNVSEGTVSKRIVSKPRT